MGGRGWGGVVEGVEGWAFDDVDAVGDVTFAVGEEAGLVAFLAAEVADLLAADVDVGAVGEIAAGDERADVAVEVLPGCGTDGDVVAL